MKQQSGNYEQSVFTLAKANESV